MPSDRQTSTNFLDIVYEGQLSGFYFMYDDPQSLHLMEDGNLMHHNTLLKQWQEVHKMKKITWPINSLNLNPIKNVWIMLKAHM